MHKYISDRLSRFYIEAVCKSTKSTVYDCIDEAVSKVPLVANCTELFAVLNDTMPLLEQFDGTSVENEKLIDRAKAVLEKANQI